MRRRTSAVPVQTMGRMAPTCGLRSRHPDPAGRATRSRPRPPGTEQSEGTVMVRIGKKAAGRWLDGKLWDEFLAAPR
jgi:hypothetical protein